MRKKGIVDSLNEIKQNMSQMSYGMLMAGHTDLLSLLLHKLRQGYGQNLLHLCLGQLGTSLEKKKDQGLQCVQIATATYHVALNFVGILFSRIGSLFVFCGN